MPLTESDLAAIEAAIVHDPFGHMPDSVFRQAGTFRPKLDDVPVEITRSQLRALLADLRAARQERDQAREHRQILREVLTSLEWHPRGRPDAVCPSCRMLIGSGHASDCQLAKALAATEDEKAE